MKHFIQKLQDELVQHRNLFFVVFTFWMMAVFSFFATSNMQTSSAADASKFNAGNIISDAVMANYNAMSKDEIQAFLDSKNKCDNRDYNLYLEYTKAHPTIKWHWEGEPYNGHFVCLAQERFGDTASEIGFGQTAAEIIYNAAQENRINPQVLLVLLQKESSLITDKVPNSFDYGQATGYGCPDTAACDKKYSGFKNQVYRAAELFRYTLDNGYSVYPEGRSVRINYHPNANCGGTQVYIENRATAALYRYTPYQPNAAALSAGYGQGNSCSAYGNRNFYLYFTDWFGSTQVAVEGELINIPDGEYSLISALNSERVMGINKDNVELVNLSSNDQAYRWRIEQDDNTGYYTFTNVATGKRLDLKSSPAQEGTNVQVWSKNNVCDQQWKIYQTKDNYITIETACTSGMVLDTKNNSDVVGGNIQTGLSGAKTTSQKWILHSGRSIDDGVYQIVSALDSNRDQVLDINSAKDINGTNVSVWQQYQDKGHQIWQFQYQASGDYYKIINPYTGKSLDAEGGLAKNGTNIELWEKNDACAQRWKVIAHGDTYSIHSACYFNYVLDLNGAAKNGTNVSLWQYHGGNNQQWYLRAATPAVAEGTYTITSRLSSLASFDILDRNDQEGANVAIWELHGGANQQWRLDYNEIDGTYKIFNSVTEKYLSVASRNASNGDNIQMQKDNDTCTVKWYIYNESDSYYRIISACHTRTAVDLNDGFKNGNNITIWQSHGGQHQQWRFVKL